MPEKEIELFSHNENGYEKLVTGLAEYPLALLEHATGTGKSFILIKYLYNKMRKKRILFVSTHEEMFSQLFDEQMPSLGVKREDFYKFDTLIYANIMKKDMKEIIQNYDCIVFDEAHHCGADKWGKKIMELKKLVLATPGKQMIGATATGIRYLDDYMDVSEIFFDGHTVSSLPVPTAILKNLLPAPFYINSMRSCEENFDRILKKLKKVPRTKETIELTEQLEAIHSKIAEENSIKHTLEKYNVKPGEKYIVFCKDINDLNKKRKEAEGWFKDIGPIKTFAAHSNQKKSKNMSEIEEFRQKRNEISLMFAVDIFNEGFHINGVDGVLMFRKTKSPIVYFQQLGRALSFSARKKQIKIFDFVNNFAENDVISELYKEVIAEAKRLIKEHPENKALYEEILNRFQIIDETTQILDELKKIEKTIDEKYIVKNKLENAILKLEEYRQFYPNTNFKKEMAMNRLNKEYINAYNYICRMEDYLTEEQIERIQNLQIEFSKRINLSQKERAALLEGYETFYELKEAKYKKFITSYILFYQTYHHRPENVENPEEQNLYKEYRFYLETLPSSKIKKLMSQFPDKATVEEIILTGGYPEKEEIVKYLETIKTKLEGQIPLDNIELKVVKKINRTISLKDTKLRNLLKNIDEINIKIERAIETIKEYKQNIDPKEKFDNLPALVGEPECYRAIYLIHKYAKRITTPQFEKLLSLDIKLPSEIDMSLEERKRILGSCNSIYEKEQNDSGAILNNYLSFVKTYHRRPEDTPAEERALKEKYIAFIKKSSVLKLREICDLLKSSNVELSFYEKVITGEPVDSKSIDQFIASIQEKLIKEEEITKEELKLLRAIERHNYICTIADITNMIKQVINRNEIEEIIKHIEEIKTTNFPPTTMPYAIKRLVKQLMNKRKYITKNEVEHLRQLGIEIPNDLEEMLNKLESINLFEEENRKNNTFLEEFTEYIKSHQQRPPESSVLNRRYREYIAPLSKQKVLKFTKILTSAGLPLTMEETLIITRRYNTFDCEEYLKKLSQKTENNLPLDALETRILNIIKTSIYFPKETRRKYKISKSGSNERNAIERRKLADLRSRIRIHPEMPIKENDVYNISFETRQKLEQERVNLLSKKYFYYVLSLLRTRKKPLIECLTQDELRDFQHYANLSTLDEECQFLLAQISNQDVENKYISQRIKQKECIERYIRFIKTHQGLRPNENTEEEEERKLAQEFYLIQENMSKKELATIEKAIAESITLESKNAFFERFCAFIEENGRFPCGNSDNPIEVQLNNMYASMGETLQKEEIAKLKVLKRKYGRATLQANIAFAKKKK